MLVAPSEPRTIKLLGQVSSLPEKRGADLIFPAHSTLVCVQRKEISDLIASVQDGRLAKEIQQLRSAGLAVLIIEGRLRWSSEGLLMNRDYGQPWTRTAHRNLLRSVQQQGVWVDSSEDVADTVSAVLELQEWVLKPKHQSLLRRPGPISPWGKAGNEDWEAWLLQGLDGVGPELAARIVKKFGGAPLQWRVTEKELMEVDGIGPKKARQMVGALEVKG